MYSLIEELLEKPCWVIDFLPEQVPENSAGRFFAVEQFYLQEPRRRKLRRQFVNILLKLYCYRDIRVCEPEEEEWKPNPAPAQLFQWIDENKKDLLILLPEDHTLITLNRNEISMTVYNPPERILKLLDRLATAEGLFLWQPPRKKQTD